MRPSSHSSGPMRPAVDRVLTADETLRIGRELLREGSSVRIRLDGYSMWPLLRPGDIGIVTPCDTAEIRPGDIIAIELLDRWVAHRLMKVLNGGAKRFVTRGDSCLGYDVAIEEERVIGIVSCFERNGRSIPSERVTSSLIARSVLAWPDIVCPAIHQLLRLRRMPLRVFKKLNALLPSAS
jgi:signal peptidase I